MLSQVIKNPPTMPEMLVLPLGQEGPLEEGMATHSSVLFFFPMSVSLFLFFFFF